MQTCEKCGSEMVTRKNRRNGSLFLGCSGYPKCRNIKSLRGLDKNKKREAKVERPKVVELNNFILQPCHEAIFEAIKETIENLMIEAVAGGGKTSTLLKCLNLTVGLKVCFVAFNRRIKLELEKKAPAHVDVMTISALGRKVYNNHLRSVTGKGLGRNCLNSNKTKEIAERLLPDVQDKAEKKARRKLIADIKKTVSLIKGTLTDPTNKEEMDQLVDHFSIESADLHKHYDIIAQIIEEEKKISGEIDFDDMYWLPVQHELGTQEYDIMFVDEAQDLNKAHAKFVQSMGKRIIAVGDRFQSIYGFTGADTESIPNMIEAMNMKTLPLSTCYRCPKSHIEMAQQIVPHIEAREGAEDGEIDNMDVEKAVKEMKDGDMGICRNNAPLIGIALGLIKEGKKAVVIGRNIGSNLIELIEAMGASDMIDLVEKIGEYKVQQTERLNRTQNNQAIDHLNDMVACIHVFIENSDDIEDMIRRINTIFTEEAEGITFSSVHRAKGLEADNVYIISPELMPSSMASKDWEMKQETNLMYVAYTRAKKRMVFVDTL